MVPINVSDDKLEMLANKFCCSKGTLPFTCLELPLGLTKPIVADFWPIVSKCERGPVAFPSYLNEEGRLELTNAVLTNLLMQFSQLSHPLPCVAFCFLR